MGYYSVDEERWRDFLRIPDSDLPERLIVEGHIDFPGRIERRGHLLDDVRPGWMPNLVLGEHEGRTVAYGVCFGGPMASQFAHIYCKLGVGKVVQIGICGGLQADIGLGDVVVSEGVLSLDGAARLYGCDGDLVGLDGTLVGRAVSVLGDMGIEARVGRTVSYFDILLEREEDLADLSASGYMAMEMEAAATAAVADHFGTPAVSILAVADNSISGKDLFYRQTDEERDRVSRAIDAVFEAALRV